MIWEWDFNYNDLHFTPAKRRPGEKAYQFGQFVEYVQEIAAFDIETCKLPDNGQSYMYVWQFAINDICVMGRTWFQLRRFLMHVKYALHGRRLMTFVHNLSFEGQYLSGIYDFDNSEVFAVDSRKLLKMAPEKWGLELRCSYRLTQLSLDQFTARYDVQHKKLSGVEYDYSKVRYPDTELTPAELAYCENDVLGLVEAVKALMQLYGDTVYSLPLTSTGFVRREVKRAARADYHQIKSCWPSYEVYKLLRAAFRGGNTHASRFYAGEIVENVKSRDISSSYPSQQVNKLLPVSELIPCVGKSVRYLEKTIEQGYAVLMDIRLYNVELWHRYIPVPYIPIAKCPELVDYQADNGRVLCARQLRIALTDIDWKIVTKQYKFARVEVVQLYRARYGPLPDSLRECNLQYFRAKTQLKGVVGQELFYAKSKELLCS